MSIDFLNQHAPVHAGLGTTGLFGAVAAYPFVGRGVALLAQADPAGIVHTMVGAVVWVAVAVVSRVALAYFSTRLDVDGWKRRATAAELRVRELESAKP